MQLEGDDGKTLACFVPSEAGKVSGSCYLSASSYCIKLSSRIELRVAMAESL